MLRTLSIAVLTASLAVPALAGPAQERLLDTYRAQAQQAEPGFVGFSAERGRAFYLAPHTGGQSSMSACASCHTPDPTQVGRHVKTGREIDPMAAHVTPDRFTDLSKAEKRFSRDCPNVLGRECTAREKGDFVLFLTTP